MIGEIAELNPTLDWDATQASAERHLRRTPEAAAMSNDEIRRAAARFVEHRRRAKRRANGQA